MAERPSSQAAGAKASRAQRILRSTSLNNENAAQGSSHNSSGMASESQVTGLEQVLQSCTLEECCEEVLMRMFESCGIASTYDTVDRVAKRFKGMSVGDPDQPTAQPSGVPFCSLVNVCRDWHKFPC